MNPDPTARESLMDPQQATLKVVMVDDEEALCLGVRRIIQKYKVHVADVLVDADYEFRYFTSGEEYLTWLGEGGEVDLLLLDLKLPGVGGMDVLDAMSAQGRAVLTIMITAYATFETAVKATKLGAYDFLAKPFTPEELRYALRKATSQLILSKQALKLAEEKREIRFNFISVLAHELKAPLNAVEGYLNILRTTEADQNLQMVERSIVRVDGMKKLIMDLLDLTRIESGQRERVIKRAGPARAGQGVDGAVRRRRRAPGHHRGARGRAPTSSSWPTPARSRSSSTTSSRTRSSTTATAATSRSGCSRKGDAVTVTVSDTGIGLSAEEAGKLFNEFTRIKNEQTVKILGSGLGLSTVRKIANMYDGEAKVTSEPGVGSTFTVTLHDAPPAGAAPAPEPAADAAVPAAPQL